MKKNFSEVKWASTEWLENNLSEDLIILDTQPNIHDYIQEHIPGAIYFNEGLLRLTEHGRPGVYVPTTVIEKLFSRIGLTNEKKIVVYTGKGVFSGFGDGLAQTFLTYSLARFGLKDIHVLDGGLDKWKEEKRTLTKEFPKIKRTEFTTTVNEDNIVGYEEFKNIKDNDDILLLDARPKAFYVGQGPWIKPGHIPGAINVPWKSFMTENNPTLLKNDELILGLLREHDIKENKKIICSCGTGREATNEFLLFNWYLNFPNVRIYEGSYTEWTSYPDNPTVIGEDPR